MTTPTYDMYRQTFALSLISNRGMDLSGTQQALLDQLQLELSAFIAVNQQTPTPLTPSADFVQQYGDWELIWGPAGTAGTSGSWQVLNNAMYVAYCPAALLPGSTAASPVYVVAIAATNPASAYDWVVEDVYVKDTVAFTGWDPLTTPYTKAKPNATTPLIAMGTAIGVGQLLALTAPATAAGAGQSLQQLLAGLTPDPAATIVFCGHSLAGALAPTLALYLTNQNTLGAFGRALVYPTAGPSPGNAAFATLFGASFKPITGSPATYQAWNQDLCNSLDVVPHAWLEKTLGQIPTLYNNTLLNCPRGILAAVAAAKRASHASGIAYTPIQNVWLTGTTYTGGQLVVPPTTDEQFLLQLVQQHMTAYWSGPNQQPGLILAGDLPQVTVPLLPGVTQIGQAALLAAAEQSLSAVSKKVG